MQRSFKGNPPPLKYFNEVSSQRQVCDVPCKVLTVTNNSPSSAHFHTLDASSKNQQAKVSRGVTEPPPLAFFGGETSQCAVENRNLQRLSSNVVYEPPVLAFFDGVYDQSAAINDSTSSLSCVDVREPSPAIVKDKIVERAVENHPTETFGNVDVDEPPPLAFFDGLSVQAAVERIASIAADRRAFPLATVELSSHNPRLDAIQDSHSVEAPQLLSPATCSIELNRGASSENNNTVEREICITCCAQLDTLSKQLKEHNMHLYKLTKAVIHNNVKNKSFTCPNCSAGII